MSKILIYCDGGLGNRYNALISGISAAELFNCRPDIYWPVNNWCEAEYSDIFGNNVQIHTSNLIDLKKDAPSWLVLSHDLRNAEYLGVPFLSAYGFSTEAEFTDFCLKDGRDVFLYPALILPWISQERLRTVARGLPFHPDLVAAADKFVKESFSGEFYGLHLRRTDLVLGYSDAEVKEIILEHKDRQFFVCSDSEESEKAAAQYSNVRVRNKMSYVERQDEKKNWSDITLDTSKRAYHSNVRRNAQGVRDALVDLLILSQSIIVGKSASTFMNVARFIKELSTNKVGNLPEIYTIPIEESFNKASAGVLDVMQAISAAQQLWSKQRYHQAVELLRLWLKQPNSTLLYVVFFNLSVYLQNLGALHEAEAYLRQCVYQQPDFLQGHLQLGLLLEKLKRPDEAITHLLKALSITRKGTEQDNNFRMMIIANLSRLTQETSH
ncbi:MAG: hypothetical protein HQM08_10105 [Candidatus Riflebacteria bacterium]|nr:hypothetical protein [Candidatus Riflebacteria bacterium]